MDKTLINIIVDEIEKEIVSTDQRHYSEIQESELLNLRYSEELDNDSNFLAYKNRIFSHGFVLRKTNQDKYIFYNEVLKFINNIYKPDILRKTIGNNKIVSKYETTKVLSILNAEHYLKNEIEELSKLIQLNLQKETKEEIKEELPDLINGPEENPRERKISKFIEDCFLHLDGEIVNFFNVEFGNKKINKQQKAFLCNEAAVQKFSFESDKNLIKMAIGKNLKLNLEKDIIKQVSNLIHNAENNHEKGKILLFLSSELAKKINK
ncbi:MAG: hypothetical protein IPH62_15085 [Ignavibacteriae bacterium]|nr:hypothetical protein [Ignavibacteriota bacterium]